MIKGYCKPMSVAPGDTIEIKVSSSTAFDLVVLRLNPIDTDPLGQQVRGAERLDGNPQDAPLDAWGVGCGWTTAKALLVPETWRSGIYSAQCTGTDGAVAHLVFVVSPASGHRGDIAALANLNTWNAYNGWGGRSKYTEAAPATLGSFERPFPVANPVPDGLVNHLTRAELWVLNWFEQFYEVDVYADIDLDAGVLTPGDYRVLLLNTHPEYWTLVMWDRLVEYLDSGGSVLYLGANGVFERCEYNADRTALTFWGGDPTQGRERNYLRNLSPPRPERELLGIAFRFNNYLDVSPPAPLAVVDSSHRFFRGTSRPGGGQLANGDLIGVTGRNRKAGQDPTFGAASGWEMDTSRAATAPEGQVVDGWEPDRAAWVLGADGVLTQRPPASDRGTPPANVELLARGTNFTESQGAHAADMTYYEHPGGGFVFAAGSLTFGGSLVDDTNLQQIVINAVDAALQRAPSPPAIYGVEPINDVLVPIDGRAGLATGGRLQWYRHEGWDDGTFRWQGPRTVGKSWANFKTVFSGGDGIIYGVEDLEPQLVPIEGRAAPPAGARLVWYRHLGQQTGSFTWDGPRIVGHGWNEFVHVFSGGHGVIYCVRPDGDLIWYRHLGRQDGSFRWEGPTKVGHGWAGFKHVFSGGNGVIYAIEERTEATVPIEGRVTPAGGGHLLWYRHNGWVDGSDSWQPQTVVGNGWADFHEVFAGTEAVIYAIEKHKDAIVPIEGRASQPSGGQLVWYRHLGREDGSFNWEGPNIVGRGWSDFKQAFTQ